MVYGRILFANISAPPVEYCKEMTFGYLFKQKENGMNDVAVSNPRFARY